MTSPAAPVEFELPAERVASEPAEARGLARDEVRLLVARPGALGHTVFRDLGGHLDRGDVLVVNTSPTMPAALDACGDRGPVTVHLSSPLGRGEWIIELRRRDRLGPVLDGMPGEELTVASGATLTLLAPDVAETGDDGIRLWRARLETQGTIGCLLKRDGRPIRYGYVPDRWPMAAYQTIFAAGRANTFGSAEMPSAARPFTPRLVAALRRRGVNIAPVTLHAGVSSLEAHEAPRPERFAVPWRTAGVVNRARRRGRRVISVGTTAARALETAARPDGTVRAAEGWTDLVLDGARQARVVGGLVTGWHPPQASHLRLLEAVAGVSLVASAYRAALYGEYLWHEFGDSCLFLPDLG